MQYWQSLLCLATCLFGYCLLGQYGPNALRTGSIESMRSWRYRSNPCWLSASKRPPRYRISSHASIQAWQKLFSDVAFLVNRGVMSFVPGVLEGRAPQDADRILVCCQQARNSEYIIFQAFLHYAILAIITLSGNMSFQILPSW